MAINTSIIITSKDLDKYLGRCIRSCLKQSLNKIYYEIIVVDDCSTDNSREVIESFGSKIKSIYLPSNVGVAEASNKGILKAIGKFIIRVDADDYISEHCLLIMTEILMANADIGFVYSDKILVDKNENKIGKIKLNNLKQIKRHGAGILFRKSNLEAIGLYDKKFKNAEDHDLITRYFKNFDGFRIPLPLYYYRKHQSNMTKNLKDRKKYEQKADDKNNSRSRCKSQW